MKGYIDLKRHFLDYQDDKDPEAAAQQSYINALFGRDTNIYWDNLLESQCVVVLGEAGSGKHGNSAPSQTSLNRRENLHSI